MTKGLRQLFLGAACLGFAPIFVKLVDLGPTPIGAYRCAIAAILLGLFAVWEKPEKNAVSISPKLWLYIALAGFLFAVDLFVWHRSVVFAGAGLGTILGNTQIFYSAAAGIFFFGEKLTSRFLLSVALAFIGTYLLVSFRIAPSAGDRYWEGVLYGLSTGVVYCSFMISMRQVERYSRGISPTKRLALISATTALSLVAVASLENTLRWPTAMEWLWLIALAIVAQVAGWLLISRNLLKVPVSQAGLILITQPLVAVIVGGLVFREQLSTIQVIGAGIVLVALYLGNTRANERVSPYRASN